MRRPASHSPIQPRATAAAAQNATLSKMLKVSLVATLIGAALFAVSSSHAGTVDVKFSNPEKYVDLGTSQWDERDNIKLLGNYFQVLGQKYLPADQRMKVEVIDVDLAGSVQASRRDASLTRKVTGRTDYPRITVRYTLQDAKGQQVASGEEAIVDLDYTHGLPRMRDFSGLYFEKHMLDKWFKQRFVDQRAAS